MPKAFNPITLPLISSKKIIIKAIGYLNVAVVVVSATKERLQNSLYRLIMTLISIILLLLFSSIRYMYGKLVEGNIWLSVCMESIVYGVYRHFLNLCCKSFTTQVRGISVNHKLICINILSSLLLLFLYVYLFTMKTIILHSYYHW